MQITFKFKNDVDFKKAQEALKKAIDTMASPRFDHSIQINEKTITILDEKNAGIIEGLFKQNQIKNYSKKEDMGWIGIAGTLRSVASSLYYSQGR